MNDKKELTCWQVDQSQPYFYYDPEGEGFVYFSTEEERDIEANKEIQQYLDNEWNEDVTSVVCGTITGRATMVDKVVPVGDIDDFGDDENGENWGEGWDYKCNYVLKPLDHVEPTK